MRIRAALLLASLLVGPVCPQAEDPWTPLRFLVGKWEGKSRGKPGEGASTREYRFELRGRYLAGKNRVFYAPKQGRSEPEVHEDWSFYSYDRAAQKLILRQFHVEGFVNEYELASLSEDKRRLEFVTRRIENIPEGWRARETYQVLGPDEFIETFELAAPGHDFEVYSEGRFRRSR